MITGGARDVDLTVTDFQPFTRPTGCDSALAHRLGTPFRDDASSTTYVWDPENALGAFDDVDRGRGLDRAELPETAVDTGFRHDRGQLWLDPADPGFADRVTGASADVLVRDAPRRTLCA